MSTTLRDVVPERVQKLFGHKHSADADDIVKGAIAGAVGGVVGTLAMAGFQQMWMRLTTAAEKLHHHREPNDEDRNHAKNAGIGEGEFPQSEPRSHHHRVSPSERLVATVYREVIHRPAKPMEMKIGGSAIHFGFGAVAGAMYGAAAEVEPMVTVGQGTAFGTAVFIAADEIALPLTGLAEPPQRTPARRHAYALFSHFAYGVATELTRRLVREQLGN
jgi:putative membrane protein